MLSRFYQRYSWGILGFVLVTFPLLAIKSDTIRSNNDIETWLPDDTPVRMVYEEFKHQFGVEEVILIGLADEAADDQLIEALASRFDLLPGIRKCWTPQRMEQLMQGFGISAESAHKRLEGLMLSEKSEIRGLVLSLNNEGIKNRAKVVRDVKYQLEYCQIPLEKVSLSGAPVIVTELDNLGSHKSSRAFFVFSVIISYALLFYCLNNGLMAGAVLFITVWGIFLTQALLAFLGWEMNFILGALSIMVMIFTLSISIHFLSYYSDACKADVKDPLGTAMKQSLYPCSLATITSLIGLLSLNVSNIKPVTQFGYAAGLGSLVAFFVGLWVIPSLLIVWPRLNLPTSRFGINLGRWGEWILNYKYSVLTGCTLALLLCIGGLRFLETDIDPAEFLPKENRVYVDLKTVERDLTSIDCIEAVVDFRGQPLSFLEKLEIVRGIEQKIRNHPNVRHCLSLASFFPDQMREGFSVLGQLNKARRIEGQKEFMADGDRLWRISARVQVEGSDTQQKIIQELEEATAGSPILFTGITPMLEQSQLEIFTGFWESFTAAFGLILLVMVVALRSISIGCIAMIPNLVPIWIVFGIVGYMGMSVDIGMMMTGSIALGISVDCTFHFLIHFRESLEKGRSRREAVLDALEHTGEPMLESAIVGAVGMLALCGSNFVPTVRFGCLMSSQMLASLLGELVLLPVLLYVWPFRIPGEVTTAGSIVPVPHLRKKVVKAQGHENSFQLREKPAY